MIFFKTILIQLGVFKKTKKPIKSRKPEKNNRKNRTVKKNLLNRLKFWKNGLVRFRFGFLSLEPEKPNRTEKKPSQTEKPSQTGKTKPNRKNRAKPDFALKNWTEPNWNRSVWTGFGFFKKKKFSVWLLFLIKTKSNRTVNTPSVNGNMLVQRSPSTTIFFWAIILII